MKPGFALSLSQDGIRLYRRTAAGWMRIGEVDPETRDLSASMGYLRKTAVALSPQGFQTKLILPETQLLYLQIDAPGPDKASRRAQIARALEGRTPYPVRDLVFDWTGDGPRVTVAVVARLTLDEAEAFAEEHRLHPVSFVAAPGPGQFGTGPDGGEPFFGTTRRMVAYLPLGERLERDDTPVRVHLGDATAEASSGDAGRDAVASGTEDGGAETDDPGAPFIALDDGEEDEPRDGDTDASGPDPVAKQTAGDPAPGAVEGAMRADGASDATREPLPADAAAQGAAEGADAASGLSGTMSADPSPDPDPNLSPDPDRIPTAIAADPEDTDGARPDGVADVEAPRTPADLRVAGDLPDLAGAEPTGDAAPASDAGTALSAGPTDGSDALPSDGVADVPEVSVPVAAPADAAVAHRTGGEDGAEDDGAPTEMSPALDPSATAETVASLAETVASPAEMSAGPVDGTSSVSDEVAGPTGDEGDGEGEADGPSPFAATGKDAQTLTAPAPVADVGMTAAGSDETAAEDDDLRGDARPVPPQVAYAPADAAGPATRATPNEDATPVLSGAEADGGAASRTDDDPSRTGAPDMDRPLVIAAEVAVTTNDPATVPSARFSSRRKKASVPRPSGVSVGPAAEGVADAGRAPSLGPAIRASSSLTEARDVRGAQPPLRPSADPAEGAPPAPLGRTDVSGPALERFEGMLAQVRQKRREAGDGAPATQGAEPAGGTQSSPAPSAGASLSAMASRWKERFGTSQATGAPPDVPDRVGLQGQDRHIASDQIEPAITGPVDLPVPPGLGGAERPSRQKPSLPRPVKPAKGDARGALMRALVRARDPASQPKRPLRRTVKAPGEEAAELTVFGARRGPSSGRKSGMLGLTLTIILVAVMAGVAFWSLLFGDTAKTVATLPETPAAAATATSDRGGQLAAPVQDAAGEALSEPPSGTGEGQGPSFDALPVEGEAKASAPDAPAADTTTALAAAEAPALPVAPEADAGATAPAPPPRPQSAESPPPATGTDGNPATAASTARPATVPSVAVPSDRATTDAVAAAAAATAGAEALVASAAAASGEVLAVPDTLSRYGQDPAVTRGPGTADRPQPDADGAPVLAVSSLPVPAAIGPLPESTTEVPDPAPSAMPVPVPYAQLVRLGPDGLIIPTPEGVITPGGFTLFAGKPPALPGKRPAPPAPPAPVEPALQGIAPASLTPETGQTPAGTAGASSGDATAANPGEPPGVPVEGARPLPKPVREGSGAPAAPIAPVAAAAASAVPQTAGEQAIATGPSAVADATAKPLPGVTPTPAERPRSRPADLAAVAAAIAAPTAGAPLDSAPQTLAPETLADASRLAVARSARPAPRPSALAADIDAAIAVAAAEPDPQTIVTPVPVEPAPPPAAKPADAAPDAASLAAPVAEEVDEPEPGPSASPGGTRADVAREATIRNAMNLANINLIGVFGSSSDRRALVRTSGGRFVRVKVGDRLDGGQVAAIGETELTYVKNGRTIRLKMIRDS